MHSNFEAPVRGFPSEYIPITFGTEKLKNFEDTFISTEYANVTDIWMGGQTDRHHMTA